MLGWIAGYLLGVRSSRAGKRPCFRGGDSRVDLEREGGKPSILGQEMRKFFEIGLQLDRISTVTERSPRTGTISRVGRSVLS